MVVFQYEWKRNRRYILTWAVSLAACIFIMTPVYNSMVGTGDALPAGLKNHGFLVSLGMSVEMLQTPFGMYAFLTSFFKIAAGIYGMYLGISLFTKDCAELTGEYLYTKPISRPGIYIQKDLCMVWGMFVMGVFYIAASIATMSLFHPGFNLRECLLVAVSFPLHALLFGMIGILVGVMFPRNRSSMLTAFLTVILEYGIYSFSSTIDSRIVSFLSPFSFFAPEYIQGHGSYDMDYLLFYLFLIVILTILSYRKQLRRDIALAV